MRQGKCLSCRVRYLWDRDVSRLRNLGRLSCPSCGGRLYSTTHRLRWSVTVAKVVGRYPGVRLVVIKPDKHAKSVTVIRDPNGPGGHVAATFEGDTAEVVGSIFNLIGGKP
jgi:hypothetical protein